MLGAQKDTIINTKINTKVVAIGLVNRVGDLKLNSKQGMQMND